MLHISVCQGDLAAFSADTVIVNLFHGVTTPGGATGALDRALNGAISALISAGDLTGAEGETRTLYPQGAIPARRVIVVGLGKREAFDLLAARNSAARAILAARQHGADHVATLVHGAGIGGLDVAAATQALVEGSVQALHQNPSDARKNGKAISRITLVELDPEKLATMEQAAEIGRIISAGVIMARDLVFLPPNSCTPDYLADIARQIAARHGMAITVGGRKWARQRHMGAFLAVAQGAGLKPRFIVLEHNADRTDLPTLVLVGKGIVFDSGGLTLKSGAGMVTMKNDMGGAAVVLALMETAAALDLPFRLIGIAPCTENKPDADAFRPGDVISASNGKTIEIISTDAEGRLVLADALVLAKQYTPDLVIDIATLTGIAANSLGHGMAAALFSTEDRHRDALMAAATTTRERVWPFPLWPDYLGAIRSPVADIKNSGGADGGLGASAIFLHQFTDYPWMHLDIAGVVLSHSRTAQAYEKHGATGFGVRLLTEFMRTWSH
jgi:leucyl aminopeptidase